jgi:hypothetical protein
MIRFVTTRRIQLPVSETLFMLGESRKRPSFARPAQPRTPSGRRLGGIRPGRRQFRPFPS